MNKLRASLQITVALMLVWLGAACQDASTVVGPVATPHQPAGDVATSGSTEIRTYSISPQQTFLRTETNDQSLPSLVVNLASLGIRPGDQIRLERLGDYTLSIYEPEYINSGIESATALQAVFSSSSTLLGATTLNRVPGAIGIGINSPSPATLFTSLPTDIPEDFFFSDLTIPVPAGGAYLFIGVPDSWYKDNADGNRNLGVRLTYTPQSCVALQSLMLSPATVVGGVASPRGVAGTVTLQSLAQASGEMVSLKGEADWPLLNVPSPQVVSVPGSVTVPSAQVSATFPITTYAVNYPLVATITGTACGSKQTAKLLVTPTVIPPFGPAADARVQAILDQFLVGGNYDRALDDIITLRNSNPSSGIGQDIYLAAADHYLFALTWVLEHPAQIVLVAGFVPMYEIVKLTKELGTDQPASPPSRLSVWWGEKGVIDAVRILYGANAIRGR